MTTPPDQPPAGPPASPPPAGAPTPLPAAPESFDPYRFGRPEHPVPPEYAPPGYVPPPAPPVPPAAVGQPGQPYAGGPPPTGYPGGWPGYPGPGGYGPYGPPPPYRVAPRGNPKAVTALVLGILSIPLAVLTFFDLLLIIPAIVFGSLALSDARRGAGGLGMARAGLICTAVGTVLAVVVTTYALHVVNTCSDEYGSGSHDYNVCIRQKI